MTDEIIAEVRRARQEIAEQCGNDPEKIWTWIKEQEAESDLPKMGMDLLRNKYGKAGTGNEGQ